MLWWIKLAERNLVDSWEVHINFFQAAMEYSSLIAIGYNNVG